MDRDDMIERYVRFFREYVDDEGKEVYINKLRDLLTITPKRSLPIDWMHLNSYDPELANELIENPEESINAAEDAIQIVLREPPILKKEEFKIHARFFNLPTTLLVKELASEHINRLIQVEGIITRVSEVKPYVAKAVFICKDCGNEMLRLQKPYQNIIKPTKCDACGSRNIELNVDKSRFVNFQSFRLQDRPESLKGGQMPRFIDAILLDDLVDTALPGDRVIVTGILRVILEQKDKRPIFKKILEVNHIEPLSKEIEELEITPEDEQRIRELAKRKDVVDVIVDSIAPAIWGHKDVKKGIALALFGGVQKVLPDGTKLRGESHVLLVGDPGVAKCVDYETRVVLSDGTLRYIGELVEEAIENAKRKGILGIIDDGFYAPIELELYALDAKTLKVRKVKANIAWKRNAPKRMFKIKTASGREIKVTPTHPFFIFENGQFKTRKAEELKIGDFIAVPRRVPVNGTPTKLSEVSIEKPKTAKSRLSLPDVADEEFWHVIGLLTGEGYSQKRGNSATIYFTNSDDSLIERVYTYLKSLGLNPTIRDSHKGKTAKEVYASGIELYQLVEWLGISGNSAEKRVPPQLFTARLNDIEAFLRGYFDAEATVDKKRAKITLVSASKELLKGIQHLLLRFGIKSQLHEIQSRATNGKMKTAKTYYRLFITGEDVLRFKEIIGFELPDKKKILEKVTKDVNLNTNIDIIPGIGQLLKKLRTKAGLAQSQMGINRSAYLHYERGDRLPSREKVRIVAETLRSHVLGSNEVKVLKLLAESDIFWDKVMEITEYVPEQQWVYDLQVPEHHNFIANDIFVHNSQILRYVANLAPRAIYTSGKSSSAAGLCVAPDSLVISHEGIGEIGTLTESWLNEVGSISYSENIKYAPYIGESVSVENGGIKVSPLSKVWKLKAPKNLIKIKTFTGKELTLTPETKLLTLKNGELMWLEAKNVKPDEYVATLRSLEIEGKTTVILELLKDLDELVIYGIKGKVGELIERAMEKRSLNKRELAKELDISEDMLYYNWVNSKARGNIRMKHLRKLLELAEGDWGEIKAESVSLKEGRRIKLPQYLDEKLAYFAGLIAGDGDISKAGSIRFSSKNPTMRQRFKELARELFGINVKEYTEGNRTPAVRFYSKVIAHILEKLGVPPSPKSKQLDLANEIFTSAKPVLAAYIRGLFDCDGTVVIRKRGSSYVKFDTTSEKLAKKLQLAFLRFGIVAHLMRRERKGYKTTLGDKEITSKHDRWELKIYGNNILRFALEIGFEHPEKARKLNALIESMKNQKYDTNVDVVPNVGAIIKEIRTFYGLSIEQTYGSNFGGLVEKGKPISRKSLLKVVENLSKAKTEDSPLELPNEMRLEIGKTIEPEELGMNYREFYELFKRQRNRKLKFRTLVEVARILEMKNRQLYSKLAWLLSEHCAKEETAKQKLTLLKMLANSDFLWEKVRKVKIIDSPYDYVYDLTVEGSHSFIANGFVVHNTAAAVRDEFTGSWILEAGVLVLADGGIACLHPDSKVLVDGRYIRIEELFEPEKSYKALSDGQIVEIQEKTIKVASLNMESMKTETSLATIIRRKPWKGELLRIKLRSGNEITLTPNHFLIDGDTLEWKEAEKFKVGDRIVSPLKLPGVKERTYILDALPGDWKVKLTGREKKELRREVLRRFKTLAEFNREYQLSVDFLSGKGAISVERFRKILKDFGIYNKWKERPLTYGSNYRRERLKVAYITPELAYFLGFLYGDGWIQRNGSKVHVRIVQSKTHPKQINQIRETFRSFYRGKLREYERATESDLAGNRIKSNNIIFHVSSPLLAFIYEYITGNNLKNAFSLDDEALKAFIAGALDSDGCVSIKRSGKGEGIHVEFLLSNDMEQDKAFILLLRRFDVYARMIPENGVNRIRITGREDVANLLEAVKKYSIKAKNVPLKKHLVSSRNDKAPAEPVQALAREIIKSVPSSTLQRMGLWSTIYSYAKGKYQPSRIQLRKILKKLGDVLTSETKLKMKILATRDYFLDEIISIEYIPYEGYVYDLYVPGNHNFLAEGIIVHNCIDEFDKMSERDRSAIHEALEQQSYPHDFELLLADGRKVKIGELVDSLIEKNRDRLILGKDTEILPVDNLYLLAYDLEKKKVMKVKVNRVSRHKAPEKFIKLKFSNGREIIVTPEHPIMVWENGKICEKSAEKIELGDIVLGVRSYPTKINAGREKTFKDKHEAEDYHDYLYSQGIVARIKRVGPNYIVEPAERLFPREIVGELLKAGRAVGIRLSKIERSRFYREVVREKYISEFLKRVKERIAELERLIKERPQEAIKLLPKTWIYREYGITYGRLKYLIDSKDKFGISIIQSAVVRKITEATWHLMNFMEFWEGNVNFLMVKKVEEIPNEGWEWVYDITVEPYHLFVSHGLVLHNSISIAKAGITATLNARTTVIAAANPKHGRFNRHKPLPEQLDLPPTLLSRFDLIFLLLDEPDEKIDSEIAQHILKVRKGESEVVTPKVPYDLLKKYIAYARKNIHPVLTKEAMEELERYYVKMRKRIGGGGDTEGVKPIPITARQLEALIRLSEAHARMRLSEIVTRHDAREAIKIMEETLKKIAIDEEGIMDISILEVGKSSRKINKIERLLEIIEKLQDSTDYGAPADDILQEASRAGISKQEARKIIEELIANSRIYEPRNGYYKIVG